MFERLTNRTKHGIAYTKIPANESNMVDVGECYTGRIVDRIAAYEDSGLNPEQVQDLAKAKAEGRMVVLPCKVGDTVYAIADCADVLKIHDDDYFEGTGAVECPFEKDCPFDECNDDNRRVFATSCKGFWIDDDGRLSMFLDYINADVGPLDIGKTVFLTREEAEKALGLG